MTRLHDITASVDDLLWIGPGYTCPCDRPINNYHAHACAEKLLPNPDDRPVWDVFYCTCGNIRCQTDRHGDTPLRHFFRADVTGSTICPRCRAGNHPTPP